MTADEWESLCLIISAGWPGDFTDSDAMAWRVLLDDYTAPQVLTAVKALVAKGGQFRPSVAEVVAEVRRDPSKPTAAEMVRLIFGSQGVLAARTTERKGRWEAGERDRKDEQAMLDRAFELHPLLGAFVRSQGLRRLRGMDLEGDYGAAQRKLLEDAWREFTEAHEGREVAQLVAPRRDGMRALDPLAGLSRSQPVLTQTTEQEKTA